MEIAAFVNDLEQVLKSPKKSNLNKVTICDLLSKYLNTNVGGITVINHCWGSGLPPQVGLFCSIDFGRRLITESYPDKVFISNDISLEIDSNVNRTISSTGIRAFVACPIYVSEVFFGALIIQSIFPRAWTLNDIQIIKCVSAYLSEG